MVPCQSSTHKLRKGLLSSIHDGDWKERYMADGSDDTFSFSHHFIPRKHAKSGAQAFQWAAELVAMVQTGGDVT